MKKRKKFLGNRGEGVAVFNLVPGGLGAERYGVWVFGWSVCVVYVVVGLFGTVSSTR